MGSIVCAYWYTAGPPSGGGKGPTVYAWWYMGGPPSAGNEDCYTYTKGLFIAIEFLGDNVCDVKCEKCT